MYRAVDKDGGTIEFLVSEKRDKKAALRFFRKAIGQHGFPVSVTIDKSGSNTAALVSINDELTDDQHIIIRQVKYLNNIVEQNHRLVKKISKPLLGFKSLEGARAILAGIELMHMIKKGQMKQTVGTFLSPAQHFCSLAAK